jgi:TolB-like protein/tetratricopeptide (TPR) repeat protein
MSDSQQASANRAVFLSYASQDAEAARRICDALRSGGVEVWFDADGGLEHGDEWDQKIRRQIKECVLFIPLISANTQARHECYFRIEWELAAERAMGIASGVAFILPVVIDDTCEPEALVPDRFRKVQWTRLPGGVVPPEVHARFLKLWSHRVGLVSHEQKRAVAATGNAAASLASSPAPSRGKLYAIIAAVAVAAVALAGWWLSRASATSPTAVTAAAKSNATEQSNPPSPLVVSAANEKSVIVLPLENLSPDAENAFFADGMHSEITSALTRSTDLKVISRTSALSFGGTKLSLLEIAKKVNVANVITGSVRRIGGQARIQLELRRARDEAVLWTKTYDKELKDVLAIQTDIAEEVARILEARARKNGFADARYWTNEPRALDAYFKGGIAFSRRFDSGADYDSEVADAIRLCEEAFQLDPNFFPVADSLCIMHAIAFRQTTDPAKRLVHAHESKRWGEAASALVPGGGGDAALGYYYVRVERDLERGLTLLERAVRALPNESVAHSRYALALAAVGRLQEAAASFRTSLTIDPLNLTIERNEIRNLAQLRRGPECRAAVATLLQRDPNAARLSEIVNQQFMLTGTLPALAGRAAVSQAAAWLVQARQFSDALARIELKLNSAQIDDVVRFECSWNQFAANRALGKSEAAADSAREMLALAEKLREVPELDQSEKSRRFALAYAGLGRGDDAIFWARRYLDGAAAIEVQERWARETFLAQIFGAVGRPRECIELLGKLLRVPSGLTVPMLRADPAWDSVRDDPEFKALLADPKNSASF